MSICKHKGCFSYWWPCCPTLEKWLLDTCMTSRYNHGIISMEVIEAKLSLWIPWRNNVWCMQSLYRLTIWKGWKYELKYYILKRNKMQHNLGVMSRPFNKADSVFWTTEKCDAVQIIRNRIHKCLWPRIDSCVSCIQHVHFHVHMIYKMDSDVHQRPHCCGHNVPQNIVREY